MRCASARLYARRELSGGRGGIFTREFTERRWRLIAEISGDNSLVTQTLKAFDAAAAPAVAPALRCCRGGIYMSRWVAVVMLGVARAHGSVCVCIYIRGSAEFLFFWLPMWGVCTRGFRAFFVAALSREALAFSAALKGYERLCVPSGLLVSVLMGRCFFGSRNILLNQPSDSWII